MSAFNMDGGRHGNKARNSKEVGEAPRFRQVTQGFAPALSREQYTIGPKGTVAMVRKLAGGIGFLPEGSAK